MFIKLNLQIYKIKLKLINILKNILILFKNNIHIILLLGCTVSIIEAKRKYIKYIINYKIPEKRKLLWLSVV